MAKLLKHMIVQELCRELEKVESFVILNYHKLNAQKTYQLRTHLHTKKMKMKVVPNSLMQIVCSQLYNIAFDAILKGPTAIAYGGDSLVDVAKTLLEWAKKEKGIQIKGGFIPRRLLTLPEVEVLAKIPPKPVLLSQIAGAFEDIIRQPALLAATPCQNLAYSLNAQCEKLEKAGITQTT